LLRFCYNERVRNVGEIGPTLLLCVVTDEPQLMLTAGPSAMVYGATPGMYGTYPAPSGMPGYGMQMQ